MAEQGQAFALTKRCDVLAVSVSGYRAGKRGGWPDRKRLTDNPMRALIRAIHADESGRYRARVLDLFSREVVGGSLKPQRTADRVPMR